jgi:hypothetical protein
MIKEQVTLTCSFIMLHLMLNRLYNCPVKLKKVKKCTIFTPKQKNAVFLSMFEDIFKDELGVEKKRDRYGTTDWS